MGSIDFGSIGDLLTGEMGPLLAKVVAGLVFLPFANSFEFGFTIPL